MNNLPCFTQNLAQIWRKKKTLTILNCKCLIFTVGPAGLEPATP